MTLMTLTKAIASLAATGLLAGCNGMARDPAVVAVANPGSNAPSIQDAGTSPSRAGDEDAAARLSVSFMLAGTGGEVLVSLFADADSWQANEPLRGLSRAADSARIEVTLEDLPPGTYAIKAFHDVNGNGKLDTNLIGVPTEPYGFSNGQAGRFGPPSFEAASFILEGEAHQDIGLT
ncbi:DUF2141 domain-containing protein [Aquisalinus flavus]|uniref:DUF2141 domain-containing protein n=1 Tax=Aquisalinus flavus TaxID=1526572 RepID=A0A8J2Y899_9PROT|nr:DUF2141 domain-containing protein [Aquisalinus flavus]MBD0425321.1 DUF2141 domain-containing protein [Aquisalinus flavus]GGD17008.1 hypothetical protein GCM10011342_27220 [Aquisalinus flavus]